MLHINEIITPALKANVFVSAAYLLLDPKAKKGRLVRAGHSPALHVSADGKLNSLQPPGMALGLAKNNVFGKIIKPAEFDLKENDKVVLYTDGLDEMCFNDELYGVSRLESVVQDYASSSAKGMRDAILDDVLSFLSTGQQNDDLTLVVSSLPRDSET